MEPKLCQNILNLLTCKIFKVTNSQDGMEESRLTVNNYLLHFNYVFHFQI